MKSFFFKIIKTHPYLIIIIILGIIISLFFLSSGNYNHILIGYNNTSANNNSGTININSINEKK